MKILFLGLCAFLAVLGSVAYAASVVPDPDKKMVIILLGPPGSGKGTQAKKISEKLALPHISTGDLFRENLSKGTELGKRVKSYMESGNLVPDDIVIEMLMARVAQPDCKKGYLLDGFPRSLPQAEALQKQLGEDVNLIVLNIKVDDDVIVKRIEGRMTCDQCGEIYNRYFSPPSHEGVCDQCGGTLGQRSDDNATVIRERLNVYHKQTAPLESFYEKKGVLHTVDGQQNPDVVFNALMKFV